MTKNCRKCQIPKEEEDFNKSKSGKDGLNSICRECQKKRAKKYYDLSAGSYKDKALQYHDNIKTLRHQYVLDFLLKHPCVDCGESDPIVLQFDHLRDKDEAIGYLLNRTVPIERLQSEMMKCEVRCANCHIRRHSREGNFKRYQLLNK